MSSDFVRKTIYEPFKPTTGSRSEDRQFQLEYMYQKQLSGKCMSRFDWEGLPNGIDARFIEATLFSQAYAIFYYDTLFDMFMCMPATQIGPLDIQDNPTKYRVTRNGVYSREVDASDCVCIWGNVTRVPDLDIVRTYSSRLAQVDRTIEIDLLNERNPMIVACSKDQRLTLQNVLSKIYDGEPVVWGTENLSMENLASTVGVFPLNQNAGAGAVSSIKHMESKTRIWGEALTLLGIMNIDSDKRERMVVAEAGANTGQVLASRQGFMKPRITACEEINAKFPGLNVSCSWGIEDNAQPNLNDYIAAENVSEHEL